MVSHVQCQEINRSAHYNLAFFGIALRACRTPRSPMTSSAISNETKSKTGSIAAMHDQLTSSQDRIKSHNAVILQGAFRWD